MTSGEKTTIIVAIIGLVSAVAVAIVANSDKLFGPKSQPQPQPKPQPYVQPSPRPAPSLRSPPAPSKLDTVNEAVAAMQWIQARCGSTIELLVPFPPGSSIDRAARVFAGALGNSGVRPAPVVLNASGVFSVGGSFSVQKFDDWQRTHGAKDGCLLAIVPEEVRENFGRPRFDAALGGKSYGVVLPRGVISEAASKWSAVFVKASNDPDFAREIDGPGLRVEVIPIR